MQPGHVDNLNHYSNSSWKLIQEFSDISSKTLQKLADLQFRFASLLLDNTFKHLKLYIPTTVHHRLLSEVSDLAGQYGYETVGVTRQATSILAASREEMISLLDKGFTMTARPEKMPVKRSAKKIVKG